MPEFAPFPDKALADLDMELGAQAAALILPPGRMNSQPI